MSLTKTFRGMTATQIATPPRLMELCPNLKHEHLDHRTVDEVAELCITYHCLGLNKGLVPKAEINTSKMYKAPVAV